jgi:hypothetical protein
MRGRSQRIADCPRVDVESPKIVLALEGIHPSPQAIDCDIGALLRLLDQLIGDRGCRRCVGNCEELRHPVDEKAGEVGPKGSGDCLRMSETNIVFVRARQVYDNVLDHGILIMATACLMGSPKIA